MTKPEARRPVWPWVEAATFVRGQAAFLGLAKARGSEHRAAIMQGAATGVKPEGEGAGKKGDSFLQTILSNSKKITWRYI